MILKGSLVFRPLPYGFDPDQHRVRGQRLLVLHDIGLQRVIQMTRYVVKFFKEVMGDNGHGAEICQRGIGDRRGDPS